MQNIDKTFVLAGNATLTIDNGHGTHYTFKVRKPKKDAPYFVSALTGPDNESHYQYMGILDPNTGQIKPTRKSKIAEDATSFKVARWVMAVLWGSGQVPEPYSLQHDGRCGRCGRKLTHPRSLQTGIGPDCEGRI